MIKISKFSVKITQELPGGFMLEYKGECIEIEKREGEMLINMLQICQQIIRKENNHEYKHNQIYGKQGHTIPYTSH